MYVVFYFLPFLHKLKDYVVHHKVEHGSTSDASTLTLVNELGLNWQLLYLHVDMYTRRYCDDRRRNVVGCSIVGWSRVCTVAKRLDRSSYLSVQMPYMGVRWGQQRNGH